MREPISVLLSHQDCGNLYSSPRKLIGHLTDNSKLMCPEQGLRLLPSLSPYPLNLLLPLPFQERTIPSLIVAQAKLFTFCHTPCPNHQQTLLALPSKIAPIRSLLTSFLATTWGQAKIISCAGFATIFRLPDFVLAPYSLVSKQ